MSRESASVQFEGITDDTVSSDCHSGLSFENPIAIDFEIEEALARENDMNEREKVSMSRTSNSMEESCRPKKNKIKYRPYGEWAVILTVIVVIWGLLIVPNVYYRTLQVRGDNTSMKRPHYS